jgi:hypothetical protein
MELAEEHEEALVSVELKVDDGGEAATGWRRSEPAAAEAAEAQRLPVAGNEAKATVARKLWPRRRCGFREELRERELKRRSNQG